MQFGLLTVGMPLWVTRHTHAPAAMVGLVLVVNTVVVALCQVRFAAGTALAPAVVTSTAVDHATVGWSLLGMAFVAAGAGTLLVTRRARKPRK
jgi:hypothetical protein